MSVPLRVRTRAEGRDEAAATVADVFPSLDVRLDRDRRDGRYLLRHLADGDHRISQHWFEVTVGSRAVGELPGQVVVGRLRAGAFGLRHGRDEIDTTRPFLHPLDGVTVEWEQAAVDMTVLDLAAVQAAARVLSGEELHRLRFDGWAPVDDRMERYWGGVQDHVGRLLRDEELAADPILRGEAMRTAARAVLLVFPNSALAARAGRGTARPSAVDAAVAFLEVEAGSDIGLQDVADAVGVPARRLSDAFRARFDCTVTQYLRSLRFQRARADLEAADPLGADAVGAVASRWGFPHAGRFAGEYRRRFGEAPSRTLRR